MARQENSLKPSRGIALGSRRRAGGTWCLDCEWRQPDRKSACFSRTETSIPDRPSKYPSIIPLGLPPAIQHGPGDEDTDSILWIILLQGRRGFARGTGTILIS